MHIAWRVDEGIVGLVFCVLLAVGWRTQRRSIRMACIALALASLVFFQPNIHAAWRRAMDTPIAS